MRTTASICLLCQTNQATKTNSHIAPKFLTKSLLGSSQIKRAFTISSNAADKAPIISQDSPKQDFILCPDCESYFSVLETEASRYFYNGIWDFTITDRFDTKKTTGDITYRELVNMNPVVFHLFIYSIVWRCSITDHKLFQYLKLESSEEEGLRTSLLAFKSTSLNNLVVSISPQNEALIFPSEYVLLTSFGFSDATRNVIFVPPGNKNPYYLVLNQFQLMISFKENAKQKLLSEVANFTTTKNRIKVVFLTQATWESFLNKLVNHYAGASKSALDKIGKRPYFLPDDKLK